MKSKPKIIVVTGAESTGKSALTKALANHFGVPYIPEFARDYIGKLENKYTYHDVENIALKQAEQMRSLKNTDVPYVFIDTWLIITEVWFEVVYKQIPDWIENEIINTRIDLFLVCHTDLPWIPDPLRENGGRARLMLQKKYIDSLKTYRFNYKIVKGQNENRLLNALSYLKDLPS